MKVLQKQTVPGCSLHGHPGCTMPLLVSMPNEYRLGGNHPNKEKRRERNEKESMYLSFHTEQRRREHRAGEEPGGSRHGT